MLAVPSIDTHLNSHDLLAKSILTQQTHHAEQYVAQPASSPLLRGPCLCQDCVYIEDVNKQSYLRAFQQSVRTVSQ